MTYKLAVDVGGTFTDLAIYDTNSSKLEFSKIPSTPSNQAIGVTDGVYELLERIT